MTQIISIHSFCLNFSCVPEGGANNTGLVVNDAPAGSNKIEGVEHSVEMKEADGEAVDADKKKKGPSNMVSGWGKGAKVVYLRLLSLLLKGIWHQSYLKRTILMTKHCIG